MGVANAMKALDMGIRTLDSSIAGLGGCPYSPGATGNVATEDIMYALQDTRYSAAGDLDALVDIGFWISEQLGRNNESRAAKAIRARRAREQATKAKL
jgi:hydroxymethylglutaryl-CoA lyase